MNRCGNTYLSHAQGDLCEDPCILPKNHDGPHQCRSLHTWPDRCGQHRPHNDAYGQPCAGTCEEDRGHGGPHRCGEGHTFHPVFQGGLR